MKELYELRDKLCDELKEYSKKSINLDTVDKLSHTIKNLDKIIESYEMEGYSGDMPNYGGHYNYAMADDRYSNARGRNAKRDSMGRYSSRGYSRGDYSRGNYSYHGDMIDELREMMEEEPNEHIKREFREFIQKIENNRG